MSKKQLLLTIIASLIILSFPSLTVWNIYKLQKKTCKIEQNKERYARLTYLLAQKKECSSKDTVLQKNCLPCPSYNEAAEIYRKLYGKFKLLNWVMTSDLSGGRDYDRDNNNCVDFSRRFVKLLEKQGLDSVILQGQTPETKHKEWGHAWVAVMIEPMTGEFVKVEDNYKPENILYDK